MLRASASLRFLLLFLLSVGSAVAQVVSSDFNLNTDGWLAYTLADPTTTVVYSATGGVGGTGAIILQEPANGANDYFVAPAKFIGNMSAYYQGTLSFSYKLNPAWDNSAEAAMVILTGNYNSSPLSIGYLPPSGQYPTATGFSTFVFSLSTSTAWGITNSSDFVTGTLATPAQILSVLGSLSSLRVLGDWTNSQDRDLLDNFTMTAIPEPTALGLIGLVGAAAAWFKFRRKSSRVG